MKPAALIFDLDGTLLDTLDDLADSMNLVLKRFGFPGHPPEAYKYFVGDGMEVLVQRALPITHRDQATISRCFSAMREEYALRWKTKTKPYPGIPDLLDALSQKRWPLTILSNKPHDSSRMVVAELLPRWDFRLVLGARPSVPKKPDPAGALEIAEKLGVSPEGFVYLGDTGTDMLTATRAGMFPVGVLWGFRQAEELKENGAKILLEKPLDLLGYLEANP
ncbi:MAG: HAD family hydrolase [Thermodesulfobacteriota bacterium]